LSKQVLHIVAAAALLFAPSAIGSTITIPILDIGSFQTYDTIDTAQTFTGTGFAGMYDFAWAHLLGVEYTSYSRTILQADISALNGSTINSATLTFSLLDGDNGPHGVLATSYTANGTLAYSWNPPDNLGTASTTAYYGENSIDVTSLLAASVAAGAGWFGLHLQGTDDNAYMWTYTDNSFTDGYPDRANVRLTVDYTGDAVPEPATYALLAGGLLLLGCIRKRVR
jgi:hypothetical protein